jgi:hypothetical protein
MAGGAPPAIGTTHEHQLEKETINSIVQKSPNEWVEDSSLFI